MGKAKSLRHRLPNYWQDSAKLPPRTAQMVAQADHVEWVVVDTEVDALILEHSLIQAHLPRYNVRLKDDKSYPWLAVTLNEEWPRPAVVRGRKRKGVRYFGPYGHAGAIRSTLDLLVRSFPVRTCSDTKFKRHERLGRPCLLYDIDRCSGPCVGAVDHEAYDGLRRGPDAVPLRRHRAGAGAASRPRCWRPPTSCSSSGRPGCATAITAVHKAAETQQMVSDRAEDFDVVGMAEDPLEASVQIFRVRRGRVVGHRGFVAEKVEDLSGPEFMSAGRVAGLRGRRAPRCRAGCSCPRSRPTCDLLESWLRSVRERAGRHRRAPARGQAGPAGDGDPLGRRGPGPPPAAPGVRPQRAVEGADRAAERARPARGAAADRVLRHEPPAGHRLRRLHGRLRGRAGQAVRLPALQRSRRCRGNDDYAAMEEVLTRRLTALKEAPRSTPEGGRPRRFAYRPNLLLVDGGKGQLHVAERVVRELGLEGEIELAALAKQFEEVYRPGLARPRAPAARLGRAVPAPAGARRGAPLRHHLPPGAAGQADDQEHPRRHPRARADPQGPAGQGARRRQRGAGGLARGAPGPVLAARRGRSGRLRGCAQG